MSLASVLFLFSDAPLPRLNEKCLNRGMLKILEQMNSKERLPFYLVLFFGVLFRFYFAVARTDIVWPDEHFQTLEPAARVVWGFGHYVWEWTTGFRSWIGPGIFIPLFFVLKLFGIKGGPIAIYASRVMVAALSSVSLLIFDRWLQHLSFSKFSHFVALSFFALHSSFVIWGVNTLTDHLMFVALTCVIPAVYENPATFRSGLLLGIPFLIRFQSATLMFGLAIFFWIQRYPFKKWVEFGLGYALCIFILGMLDWVTLGHPFQSLVIQLTQGAKIAESFGRSPAKEYVIGLLLTLGPVAWVGMFLMFGISFLSKERRSLWYFISLPCLTYLLAHNLLAHKEYRFILPVYLAVFIWFAIGTEKLEAKFSQLKLLKPSRYLGIVVLLVGLSFWRSSAARIHSTGRDSFDLEARMREDGLLLKAGPNACVLLVGHHWALSRWEVMQAAHFDFKDVEPNQISSRSILGCSYALVLQELAYEFISHPQAQEHWSILEYGKKSSVVLLRLN